MFQLGIFSIKSLRTVHPRSIESVFSANFSTQTYTSFSKLNFPKIPRNAFLNQFKTTRTISNWNKVFTDAGVNLRKSTFINLNKPFTQKRLATFRQLGRNSYGSSEPKYNNVQNNIVKPFIFVTIFTIATYFLMPYIFQYTPMSYFKKNPQHLIWTILGLNAIIFGLWQIRYSNSILYKTLENYFIMDRSALTRNSNWSLILSSFSHQEPFHLLVNMACLYSFSGSMISMLGVTGFSSLYLIAGAWASFFSLAYSQIFRYFGRSLGASGSISGVFTAFATMFPNAGIAFFFIPIPGGASVAAGLFAIYNVAGCLMRWGNFDYAAHLGGMWVGFLWGMFLRWKAQREEEERRARLRRFGW
jgi:rhomboid-like protein